MSNVDESSDVSKLEEAEAEEKKGLRLIQISEDREPKWMTFQEIKESLYDNNIRYMDVTDFRDIYDDLSAESLVVPQNKISSENGNCVFAIFSYHTLCICIQATKEKTSNSEFIKKQISLHN
jgi:hypothetical protein